MKFHLEIYLPNLEPPLIGDSAEVSEEEMAKLEHLLEEGASVAYLTIICRGNKTYLYQPTIKHSVIVVCKDPE